MFSKKEILKRSLAGLMTATIVLSDTGACRQLTG